MVNTQKIVAFRSSGILISVDNGLKNVSKLFEVTPHSFSLCILSKTAHKDLGESGIPKRGIEVLIPIIGTRPRTRTRNHLIHHERKAPRERKNSELNPKRDDRIEDNNPNS